MSFEPRLAAALSGISLGQLRYWSRPKGEQSPLLVPEIGSGVSRKYSFRDVLALRTMAYLREEVSLQKIRRAFHTLNDLGKVEHPSQYTLVADGDTIYLHLDTDDALDLVKKPGQQVFARMVDVLSAFENKRGRAVPDFRRPRPNLEVSQGLLGGTPVVTGTRIPFDLVADLIAGGVAPERLANYYPKVSTAAAHDSVDFQAYVHSVA